jgi:tetratricopeptide (TPR) repeat protein
VGAAERHAGRPVSALTDRVAIRREALGLAATPERATRDASEDALAGSRLNPAVHGHTSWETRTRTGCVRDVGTRVARAVGAQKLFTEAGDPNRAETAFRLGFMLMMSGRVRESIAPLEQAKADDPLYAVSAMCLAWAYAQTGRKAEAVTEARRGLELDPANEAVGNIYAATLSDAGLDAEALAFARKASARATTPHRLAFYGWVMADAGARDEARAVLRRVEALPARAWRRHSSRAHLYRALGDTARALDAIERAAATDGDLFLAQPITDGRYDS